MNDNYRKIQFLERAFLLWSFLFASFTAPALRAQEVNIGFKHLSFEHGLPQNTVTAVIQDKKGFMWFGTHNGLCRYDGTEFIIHRFSTDDPNTLSDNHIQALYEDRRGMIWIGTVKGGLNRFDPVSDRFTHFRNSRDDPQSLSGHTVYFVYEDSRGILWVGTGRGLNRFDRERKAFYHYRHDPHDPASLSHDMTRCIAEDRGGILWVGTWDGLTRMEQAGPHTYNFTPFRRTITPDNPAPLTDNRVSSICFDPAGNLYIGTEKGISFFDPLKEIFRPLPVAAGGTNSLKSQNINILFRDTPEHIWIGTHTGLHLFNCKTKTITGYPYIPNMPYTLGNNQVNAIYKDRAGDLWIGIWADGVYHTDRSSSPFKTYRKDTDNPNSLSDSDITAIHKDRHGFFWIGTMNGLNRLDRENHRFKRYQHEPGNSGSLSHDEVSCIHEDHAGVIWVGTFEGGLNRFDRGNDRFTSYRYQPGSPDSLSSSTVNCIYEDPAGTLWIGTGDGGVNRLDADRSGFSHYKHHPEAAHCLSSNNIRTIYGDRTGTLWIGTGQGGLNKFNPGTQQFHSYMPDPQNPDSISHAYVLSILEDKQGRLWIGTNGGGLDSFDVSTERFTHFTREDGLPDDAIYGILEDGSGNLWLSTGKGLSHFNPRKKEFENYDWTDGLQSDEFNEGAFYKSQTGEMFFGGINGFNAFNPREIKPVRTALPVVITGFHLFNKPVRTGEKIKGRILLEKNISETEMIHLYYEQNIFSFQFAALNYVYPEKIGYSYKMENFDKEWNEVYKRNYAVYINMPPGHYTFRVRAGDKTGNWHEEGASLKLVIIPPFWRTWWFIQLLLAAAFASIYIFYRLRVRAIRRGKKELEQKVEQRTAELEIAGRYKSEFLARMSHEIRTPMNSVIGFTDMLLDTELSEEQENYVRTIHNSGQTLLVLIDDILDLTRIEAGHLTFDPIDFDPEIVCFDVCRSMIPRVGQKSIEILLRIGDHVPAFVKTDPGRFRQVVVNLIGNAIKFTDEGEVELYLDVEAEKEKQIKLHVRVRDTGIGIPVDKIDSIFEVFQQVDGSVTRKYGGTGLGLAICKHIAQMMQGDVWAESTPGKGTTFHFTAYVEKSKKKAPGEILPPDLTGKKALIVDDNTRNLDILRNILEQAGMRVHGLNSGEGAVKELVDASHSGDGYDLCILDIHLSGMSGFDVLKELRSQDSPAANLPVLAFSSSTLARSKRIKEAGFDGFLPKPVSRGKLIDMAARLLGKIEKNGDAAQREILLTRHTLIEEAKHSIRILLAEDDPVNRKLAGSLLTKAGYKLDIVENGKEAVEAYTSSPGKYDIILMDVQMPVMDGKEATRIIREKGFTNVPIVAVTADVMKGEREKLIEAGMNDYISKPIKREVIFEKVKKWAIDTE